MVVNKKVITNFRNDFFVMVFASFSGTLRYRRVSALRLQILYQSLHGLGHGAVLMGAVEHEAIEPNVGVNTRLLAIISDLIGGGEGMLGLEQLIPIAHFNAHATGVTEAGDLGVVVEGGGVLPCPIRPGVVAALAEEGGGDGRLDAGLGGGGEQGVVAAVGKTHHAKGRGV